MAQNMKRGRNQRRRSNTNVNRALDSTGPDVKIRGTALQIHDKYQALARDAASAGDRIRAESLLQHAEHYFRMLKSMQQTQQAQQPQTQSDPAEEPQPEMKTEADAEKPAASEETAAEENQPAADNQQEGAEAAGEETEKPKRRRRRPARKTAADNTDSADTAENTSGEKEAAEVAAE